MTGLKVRSSAENNKISSSPKPEAGRKRSMSTSDKVTVSDSVISRCLSLLGIGSKKERMGAICDRPVDTISILSGADKEESVDGDLIATSRIVDFSKMNCFGGQNVIEKDFQNDIINYVISRQILYPVNLRSLWMKHFGEDAQKIYGKIVGFIFTVSNTKPVPSECPYLAIYYINCLVQYSVPVLDDFEAVALAALNLAAKIERQHGISRSLFGNVDGRLVFKFEREIMQSVDNFNLNPTTLPQIRRFYTIQLIKEKWSHVFSKWLSDLSQFNLYLMQIPDILLGAVIMRLLAMMQSETLWDSRCYAISLHEESEFDVPHAVLCRLILTAQANGNFYKVFQSSCTLSNSLINAHRQLLVRGAMSIELPSEVTVFKWNDAYTSM